MIRSKWAGILLLGSVPLCSVHGQRAPAPAHESRVGEVITIQEPGKPPQQCRIQSITRQPDGSQAAKIENVQTGEVSTIFGNFTEERQSTRDEGRVETVVAPEPPTTTTLRPVPAAGRGVKGEGRVETVIAPDAAATTSLRPVPSLPEMNPPPLVPRPSPLTSRPSALIPAEDPALPSDWRQSWGKLESSLVAMPETPNTVTQPPNAVMIQPRPVMSANEPMPTVVMPNAPCQPRRGIFTSSQPTLSAKNSSVQGGAIPINQTTAPNVQYVAVPIFVYPMNAYPPQYAQPKTPNYAQPGNRLPPTNQANTGTWSRGKTPTKGAVSQQYAYAQMGYGGYGYNPYMSGAYYPYGTPGYGMYPQPSPMPQQNIQFPVQTGYVYPPTGNVAQGIPAASPGVQTVGVVHAIPLASLPTASTAGDPDQMLALLRDCLYPSHREWAAAKLGQLPAPVNPDIIHTLMTCAKEDPAPTVRCACIRSLAKINVGSVPVIAVLKVLKADSDSRVRTEAEQALKVLSAEEG